MNQRIPLLFGLLLPLFLFLFSCSDTRYFKRAVRKYGKGKTERAEKMFNKKLNDPNYDLGAAFYLLKSKTKKYRKIPDLVNADTLYANLAKRHEGISKPKAAKLKKVKASQKSVLAAQARIQHKAIQVAAQANNMEMLDSVQKSFPEFLPKVQEEWKQVETNIVVQNLGTKDYDIATSILNRHSSAVPDPKIADLFALKDKIWELFNYKYNRCKMDKFRRDHPRERLSRDCWFDAARDVFCAESVDSALAFQLKYPYSEFEVEILDFILHKTKYNSSLDFPGAKGEMIADIKGYQSLLNTTACGYTDSVNLWQDMNRYLRNYAPRYSAFVLLQSGIGYYTKHNPHALSLQMLSEMESRFPDTIACAETQFYRLDEKTLFSKHLSCLKSGAEDLKTKAIVRWDKEKTKEYDAVSWDEGNEVYFAQRSGKKVSVMRSNFDNGEWSSPVPVPSLSVANKAVPMSMTSDGLHILLKIGPRLYVSARSSEIAPWDAPRKIPLYFPKMKRAVFAPDGSAILLDAQYDPPNRLYRPKSNLYYCEITAEGKYKKPRSMGAALNTEDNEIHPYLCQDGKTLLFCSDGHDGYGGLDVFSATKNGSDWSDWSRPKNLGCLINSVWDEKGFSWIPENSLGALFTEENKCDKNKAIFQEDLPSHARPFAPARLRGTILTAKGESIKNGDVEIRVNEETEARLAAISVRGNYNLALPNNTKTAKASLKMKGYFSPDDIGHHFEEYPEGKSIRDTIRVWSIADLRKGYVLQHVEFKSQSAYFSDPKIHAELAAFQRFVQPLKAKLHVESHVSPATPNAQALSDARANIIKAELEKLGVNPDKISATGKGDSEPAPKRKSPGALAIPNERVVIKVEISQEMLKKMAAARNTASNGAKTSTSGQNAAPNKQNPPKRSSKPKPIQVDAPISPKKKKWWHKMMFWKKSEAKKVALEADKMEQEQMNPKKTGEPLEEDDDDDDGEN